MKFKLFCVESLKTSERKKLRKCVGFYELVRDEGKVYYDVKLVDGWFRTSSLELAEVISDLEQIKVMLMEVLYSG